MQKCKCGWTFHFFRFCKSYQLNIIVIINLGINGKKAKNKTLNRQEELVPAAVANN